MKFWLRGFGLLFTLPALAGLQVFPTRLKIASDQTAARLTVRNPSTQTQSYRLSWTFYRMSENGEMEALSDPSAEATSAVPLLVFSPKSVTLGAGAEQTVRVLRKPQSHPSDGEYRAHLQLDPEPPSESELSVAIPIVAQVGKVQGTAQIKNFSVHRAPDAKSYSFTAEFLQSGNAFLFGDLILSLVEGPFLKREVFKRTAFSSYIRKVKITLPFTLEKAPPRKSKWLLELRNSPAEGLALQASAEAPMSP